MVLLNPHVGPKFYVIVIDLFMLVFVHHHDAPPSMHENHTCHPLHLIAHANVVF
jgi:hypothetical protein